MQNRITVIASRVASVSPGLPGSEWTATVRSPTSCTHGASHFLNVKIRLLLVWRGPAGGRATDLVEHRSNVRFCARFSSLVDKIRANPHANCSSECAPKRCFDPKGGLESPSAKVSASYLLTMVNVEEHVLEESPLGPRRPIKGELNPPAASPSTSTETETRSWCRGMLLSARKRKGPIRLAFRRPPESTLRSVPASRTPSTAVDVKVNHLADLVKQTFAPSGCRGGEIGKRARFPIEWRIAPCGFEARPLHSAGAHSVFCRCHEFGKQTPSGGGHGSP